jgi:hypothetical protein
LEPTLSKAEGVVEELSGYRTGIPSDGIVYCNDLGQRVKLDKNGRPYPVDIDGIRKGVGRGSSRPEGVPPEIWNYLRPILAKRGQTYAEYMAEREGTRLLDVSEEIFTEAPAVASILEDWEDQAEQDALVRQIQSTISTLAMNKVDETLPIPAMPVLSEQGMNKHRPKLQRHSPFQDAMVARSVGRKEMLSNEAASQGMDDVT